MSARPTPRRAYTEVEELPLLLEADEVAVLLRTTRKAVYTMAERNQIPHVRPTPRRVLFERDELLAWIAKRRAPSPGGSGR
jgi:excisionase family DNA binding protein